MAIVPMIAALELAEIVTATEQALSAEILNVLKLMSIARGIAG